jgi:predicted nucleic acid-binding Zn ribbon protein
MLQSLERVLASFSGHPLWAELNQMQTLRQIWPEVVGEAVAAQTYPVNLRRQVLQVATSTPAWAQNLTFQRQRILKKLNSRLHPPLVDIRFSPAAWHARSGLANSFASDAELVDRFYPPPPVSSTPKRPTTPRCSGLPLSSEEAKAAFERWARLVKRQQTQQNLFPCPACGCPTPAAELERWLVCGFCHRQSLRGSSRRYPRELPPAGIASTPAG